VAIDQHLVCIVVNDVLFYFGGGTQTFYNFKNFVDFLNVCSANILVLTGLQHQYIGAVQGESKCLQHHAYSVKRCLFSQLE
jgi:hypothetical protein